MAKGDFEHIKGRLYVCLNEERDRWAPVTNQPTNQPAARPATQHKTKKNKKPSAKKAQKPPGRF